MRSAAPGMLRPLRSRVLAPRPAGSCSPWARHSRQPPRHAGSCSPWPRPSRQPPRRAGSNRRRLRRPVFRYCSAAGPDAGPRGPPLLLPAPWDLPSTATSTPASSSTSSGATVTGGTGRAGQRSRGAAGGRGQRGGRDGAQRRPFPGSVHKAMVRTVSEDRSSVSVEWSEDGVLKGKQVSGSPPAVPVPLAPQPGGFAPAGRRGFARCRPSPPLGRDLWEPRVPAAARPCYKC